MSQESDFDLENILAGVDDLLKRNPVPAAFDEPKGKLENNTDEIIYFQKSIACDFLQEHFGEVIRRGFETPEEEARIMKANFVAWRIDRSSSESGNNKKIIDKINLKLLNEIAEDSLNYWSRQSGKEVLGSREQKLARKYADTWSPITEVTGAALGETFT